MKVWPHLNQTLEGWLQTEADQRVHGTLHERVLDRFTQERAHLAARPPDRYDTAYRETRLVGWDGYINVRGNRYRVPSASSGQIVTVWSGWDDLLRVVWEDQIIATHQLQPKDQGWVTVPDQHATLWEATLQVETRSWQVYTEVAEWS
ncbi:MAG: hypothetical protein GFH27_549281n404 [Chloroflexi bacterium AL-W]|nr:hypothetical protein [Chloroflexi bacterium AL-N1]NOK66290.1 hypothetical protein [Chloroflexi bacterium AL-N10]NOK73170.1 hypothetical protein [Chloroflexi bacterium AL-N5]NOK80067.1 hypothetical protein [Chloroflexi bacterium AL-W]NOK88078.1 hypothetical protein [Chloroflexi bacterium AL-N15]